MISEITANYMATSIVRTLVEVGLPDILRCVRHIYVLRRLGLGESRGSLKRLPQDLLCSKSYKVGSPL